MSDPSAGEGEPASEPSTGELKQEQERREREEEKLRAESERPDEERLHRRRSEKAAYLKEKLAEREQAEAEED